MFAHCKAIWSHDDFDQCFQTDYLETLFPAVTCLVSLLVLLYRWTSSYLHCPWRPGFQRLNSDNCPEHEVLDQDGNNTSEISSQRPFDSTVISLRKGQKSRSSAAWDVAEVLALLGQAVVCMFRLFGPQKHASYQDYTWGAVWLYVLALAATRLFILAPSRWSLSFKTRVHFTLLYMTLWLVGVIRFRTVLLHANRATNITREHVVLEVSFSSVLLFIALVSRDQRAIPKLNHVIGLEQSHETEASLLSLAIFGWVDAIVWRGYKKTLELNDVWDLVVGDKASHVLAGFRQVRRTHSLAFRLFLFSKRKLLLQGFYAVFSNIFAFLPTLLVRGILQHLEDPESVSGSLAWLYVTLLLASGVIKTVGDNQALWIGRRVCIQFRAIIIGEVYAKALRRRATASAEVEGGKHSKPTDEPKSVKQIKKNSFHFTGKKMKASIRASQAASNTSSNSQATDGMIINLMSIDSFKVSEVTAYLHFLWASVPVQLTLATLLVYSILGRSSLAGICIMLLVMPLNLLVARSFQRAQKKIMAATDNRIHATNEILQNIRIIKYFAWESRFADQVSHKRRIELRALRTKYLLWASAATLWSAVPLLTTLASFFVYTVVEKKKLLPSVAFPALSMFALLRIPLDQLADMIAHVQEAKVSIERVENFLNEEETEKYAQIRRTRLSNTGTPRLALENATLSWTGPGKSMSNNSPTQSFRLIDIHVNFELGRLNVITGATGSGKTSLLMALLGEMKLLHGDVQVPGGYNRQDLQPDSTTGLTDSVAFCAQQAWLVNDTIRENIIFASSTNHYRYKAVISACALERDLEILDAGDQTLVGEKGIALSGGQKQRISLARALYSNARHVLLDDCLSAVDSHTARHIFDKAIRGDLMRERTCILVTHNISLAVPSASYVIVLDRGKVRAQGSPNFVLLSGAFGDDALKSRPGSPDTSAGPSRANSNLQEVRGKISASDTTAGVKSNGSATRDTSTEMEKNTDLRFESKVKGRIKANTLKTYLTAMGPWYFWILTLIAFAAAQVGSVATNVWIQQWVKAYRIPEQADANWAGKLQLPTYYGSNSKPAYPSLSMTQWPSDARSTLAPATDVRVGYYLGVYALIGTAYVSICFSREIVVFGGSLHASWRLHEQLLKVVAHAKFRIFDSTPLGQLMNRFSKDMEAIDQEVSPVAMGLVNCLVSVISTIILISVITPGFLIAGFVITCVYFTVAMFYIRSSRDLKRMESVQRSPLYQAFGETLSGVVTIRAYGDESRFIAENQRRVDTHNRPFILLWATNRWLAVRADLAGALVSVSAGLFVMIMSNTMEAGAAGLSLSYAITFTDTVLWLVRLYGANEQNMNSVERLKEYLEFEQEARMNIEETRPAANWPSRGEVEFIGYATRYRADLGRVLNNITFNIKAGEKVGIVGRTGAGKSSLALALLRGLEAEAGKILIDDVNIGLIGLQDLREAITIVPQDPTLFAGSLRSNLDPFGLFTDEEVFTALRRVQLISSCGQESKSSVSCPSVSSRTPTTTSDTTAHIDNVRSGSSGSTLVRSSSDVLVNKNVFYNLSTGVTESGGNFSQGQRQLLCLARALLKSPKVLVMDEATASIDYATDSQIQDTLRELRCSTIITIAHRLQTIIDYDKVLVLEKGEIIEFDSPWELIQLESGAFRAMCEMSGEFKNLWGLARRSWEEKRLVDDG